MVRFIAIGIFLAPAWLWAVKPAGTWTEELQWLKLQVTEGELSAVATRLRELYQNTTDEKSRAQILQWAPQLLEIFRTQSALNDFERAKTLGSKEPLLALELLSRALTTEPEHPKVLQEAARLHLQLKEQGKARPLIEKMSRDYPLLLQTHLLQWRLYSAEPDADQVKNSSLATPYPGVQELGVLLQAAHGAEVDEATALLARRVDFEGWPEIYFLAAHGPGEETAGWAQKFLISCGYGAGAAAPKYPAAICQKVPEMKELADPQQGSQR